MLKLSQLAMTHASLCCPWAHTKPRHTVGCARHHDVMSASNLGLAGVVHCLYLTHLDHRRQSGKLTVGTHVANNSYLPRRAQLRCQLGIPFGCYQVSHRGRFS